MQLLQWYLEAGVDEAVEDAPQNWFALSFAPPAPVAAPAPVAVMVSAPPVNAPPPPAASQEFPAEILGHIARARALSDAASTFAELEAAVRAFDGCVLKKTATNTVFADGNPESRLMLIGEAPGAHEDMQGIPFCGPSGQLLDAMMKAIGRDRTSFYITNTVFWRPPGNRQPSAMEIALCQPFVQKHVALVNPELLVLVGGVASSAVLETTQGISRLRGKMHTYRTPYLDRDIPVMVMFHPSYLLRQPAQKRLAWQDLLQVQRVMGKSSASS